MGPRTSMGGHDGRPLAPEALSGDNPAPDTFAGKIGFMKECRI